MAPEIEIVIICINSIKGLHVDGELHGWTRRIVEEIV